MTALNRKSACQRAFIAAVAIAAGSVLQMRDGKAGVTVGLKALAANDPGVAETTGIYEVPKVPNKVLLEGGRLWWDRANGYATFQRVTGGFYLGTVAADAAATDTTVYVNLNEEQRNRISWRDHLWTTALVGSATATRDPVGTRTAFAVIATNEAEKSDALSNEVVAVADGAILEARFVLVANGSDATVDINVGLASATHATDADSIAEHVLFHVDGGSLNINAQSKDGTTTVASTDSTLDAVVGTYNELWIDARDPANVKLYVDGVRVLDGTTGAATTLKLDHATGPLKALVHIEKTSGTATGSVAVEFCNVRSTDLT